MRKTIVIAIREYLAAVRTKAFVIGLLLMPLMMGGSLLVQMLLRNVRDIKDKHFAIIDRTPGQQLLPLLEQAVKEYNEKATLDSDTGKQVKPRFVVDPDVLKTKNPDPSNPDAINEQRLELSDLVREGKLIGFLDIGPDVLDTKPSVSPGEGKTSERASVRYQTNRPTFRDFSVLVSQVITLEVQKRRATELAKRPVNEKEVGELMKPVPLESKGLTRRTDTGEIEDASDGSRFASILVPLVLMMLMFMVVMMGATPLMQSVVEEKMQRIAEVLLGSVTPFQLMMGKLVGMAAVSLTITGTYLAGGYWAAHHYGTAEYVTAGILVWFLLFQLLASLMFGSLFIAIGAACSDMKETQSLLWPVMLLACLPMFMLGNVLQEPNGPAAVAVSFFPFATPMLMVVRESIPPGVPPWQLLVGMTLVLATTVTCVWVAGRIFRVGILMQGKGANVAQLFRWVVRG